MPMMRPLGMMLFAVLLWAMPGPVAAQLTVDPNLPVYKATSGVSGTIKSIGSDTMNNMMTLWAEGFQKMYPNVRIEIEGKGTSTAPPALIQGTATFGPMSRPMKSTEIDDFERRYGYKPTELGTGIDMLVLYVHKDNPLEGLSLQQVDAIFSTTRRGGLRDEVSRWGKVGLGGDFTAAPISLYGRNSASGTYSFFKQHALFGGDFKSNVKEQPGSSSVVQGIASDRFGIGYSGIGYKTADVRAVPLSEEGDDYIDPTPENAEFFPMSRFLLVAVNYRPGSDLDPLRREFIKYIYSQQGQTDVIKDGYLPLPAPVARAQLAKVGITN